MPIRFSSLQRLGGPTLLALYLGSCLVLWALWAVLLMPLLPPLSGTLEAVVGIVARTLFWVAPAAIYLRMARGDKWLESVGVGLPRDPVMLGLVFVATLVVAAVLLMTTAAQQGLAVETLLGRLRATASLRLDAPLFEELVFRGVVLSELLRLVQERETSPLKRRLSFWGAQLLQASFFVAIHWPSWLSFHGVSYALSASPSVFATGLVLGIVYAHTRTIWPGVFLHWLNNELSALGSFPMG